MNKYFISYYIGTKPGWSSNRADSIRSKVIDIHPFEFIRNLQKDWEKQSESIKIDLINFVKLTEEDKMYLV